VILPERNIVDLEEVPQEVRETLEFVPVTRMDEVLREALENPDKLDIPNAKSGEGKRKKSGTKTKSSPDKPVETPPSPT
jgi:ATP-dependent Lon protease